MSKIITLIWISFIMISVTQAASLDSAAYHTKAADRYAATHDDTKALGEYNTAISRDKNYFKAWLGKAKSELLLGQLKAVKESLKHVGKLASTKPETFEFLLIEGQYYLAAQPKHWLGNLKQNFFKARKIDDSRSDLHLMMARAYREVNKEALARKHYSNVIEIGGSDAAIATEELASIFRQAEARGTGKGWVGDIAEKKSINRALLATVLVEDVEIQTLFPQRNQHVALPKDCKDNPYRSSIDILINTQITSITLDHRSLFNPDVAVTRYELAKLIQEILIAYTKKEALSRAFIGTRSPFPDLSSNHYAYNAAFLAISRGLMSPDDLVEGTFAGEKSVSGSDLLLVLRKLGTLNRHPS